MPGRYGKVRTAAAAVAAAVLASLPAAGPAAAATQSPYGFQPGARSVAGAPGPASAPALAAGTTYRDAIGAGASRVYRVDLAATTDAYVSVVAVPRAGVATGAQDRLTVSMQTGDGTVCSTRSADFGTVSPFPHPVVADASRSADPGEPAACAGAGAFYVVVRRADASAGPWDLELRRFDEPPLAHPGPARAPGTEPSGPAASPAGAARDVGGGSGFHDAALLSGGTWTTRIRPGQSLFYRIPVGWGQRLFAGEDLSAAARGASRGGVLGGLLDLVPGALSVSVCNPALIPVAEDDSLAYQGAARSTAIGPLAPVDYANRYAPVADRAALRFAGPYYLEVTLNPQVGRVWGDTAYRLTLRIDVSGRAQAAPDYVRPPAGFALSGGNGSSASADGVRRTVGVLAIAAGTVLLGGLGAWTLAARRRPAGARADGP